MAVNTAIRFQNGSSISGLSSGIIQTERGRVKYVLGLIEFTKFLLHFSVLLKYKLQFAPAQQHVFQCSKLGQYVLQYTVTLEYVLQYNPAITKITRFVLRIEKYCNSYIIYSYCSIFLFQFHAILLQHSADVQLNCTSGCTNFVHDGQKTNISSFIPCQEQ